MQKLQIEGYAALGLLAFFFLPWITIFGDSVSGYQIPEIAGGIRQFAGLIEAVAKQPQSIPKEVLMLYTVYLIPICSVMTVGMNIGGRRGTSPGFIAAAVPVVFFAYGLAKIGQSIFDVLAVGAWLTLIAAGTMVAAAIVPPIAAPTSSY